MAGPTVVLKILADASQATSTLDRAGGRFAKMGSSAAKLAVPIAAAGAALFGMAKSAVEDAAGQAQLAKNLKNATGATDAQVASVEDWITKTSQASGVADDQLRPAMAALTRATGDVGKAQKATSQAMDIAAATGKPLTDVAAALAKGYSGNTGALGKMVPGLSKGVLATKDMTKISAELARLTGGAAADAANTAAGKFDRMKNSLSETGESIGGALLPAVNAVAPILQKVAVFLQNNATVVGPLVIVLGALAVVVWAVNAAMAANPFTLVAIAIAALVAALVIAYQKSDTFRAIVQAAWKAIAAAALWAWNNVLKPVFAFIVSWVRLVISVWAAAVRGIVAAAKAIGAAVMWLWNNAIRPAIGFIVGYFQFWWKAAVTAKNFVVGALTAAWQTIVSIKDKIVGALKALADKVMEPFKKVEDAIRGAIDWLGKLFDKITSFKVPKWLSSVMGKVGGAIGLNVAPTYTPAPTVSRRYSAGANRSRAASPTAVDTGAGTTMAGLVGAGTQVVVQVSDRRMVDLVDVKLRDNAAAATRSLTRRQVVIV